MTRSREWPHPRAAFSPGHQAHCTPALIPSCHHALCRAPPPPPARPTGSCGPDIGYKVGNLPDINQPANILEEIVWYKAKEIEAFREKQPLIMLQVRCSRQAELHHQLQAPHEKMWLLCLH